MSAELDNLKTAVVNAVKAYATQLSTEEAAVLAQAKNVSGEQSQQAVHKGLVKGMEALVTVDSAVTATPVWKWRLYVYGGGGSLLALNLAAIAHWGLKWF